MLENNANKRDGDGIVKMEVTTDGSWHERGHKSNFGIGAVIEMESGLLLDYEVCSKLCRKCIAKEKALISKKKILILNT